MAYTPGQLTERRAYAKAINDFSKRYHLNRPHVTSLDAVLNLRRFVDESRLAQRILGIWAPNIGKIPFPVATQYLLHPSAYLDGPGGDPGRKRHQEELAAYRAKQQAPPGITFIDGNPVAGWIAEIVLAARRDGVSFTVTSGVRTLQEQWDLYLHPQGVIVAYPGTSHHQGTAWPDGAVDTDPGQQALSDWLDSHPTQARGLRWARDADFVHFSVPGSHRSGEADF